MPSTSRWKTFSNFWNLLVEQLTLLVYNSFMHPISRVIELQKHLATLGNLRHLLSSTDHSWTLLATFSLFSWFYNLSLRPEIILYLFLSLHMIKTHKGLNVNLCELPLLQQFCGFGDGVSQSREIKSLWTSILYMDMFIYSLVLIYMGWMDNGNISIYIKEMLTCDYYMFLISYWYSICHTGIECYNLQLILKL